MGLLQAFWETYEYNLILQLLPISFLLIALFLYAGELEKRPLFFLRIIGCALAVLILFIGLAILRQSVENIYTRLLAYVLQYLCLLPVLFICYDDSLFNCLLTWSAAVATADIGARFFTILVAFAGNSYYQSISLFSNQNLLRDWIIYFGIRIILCIVIYLLFRRAKCMDADQESIRQITGLSIFFAGWIILFQGFSREYMRESDTLYMIINVCGIMLCLAVLLFRAGLLSQNRYRQEIAMTERLLKEERKQYDSFKENIEIVNMRCHDLKHQLEDISYKLTREEADRLRDALQIYDGSMKTGNEVLDVVLYEKQLVFTNENIRFSCMADGKLLQFMRTTHIYALFNNALGNALEAVRKLTEPEKKVIDLSVKKNGDAVEITVMNGYDGRIPVEDTTKSDPNRHGLGLKSMRYIAEQYNGTLCTEAAKEVFTLTCRIPLPGTIQGREA